MHPCGQWVDWLRTGYRTKARLWQDEPTQVDIRWFRAEDSAGQAPPLNHYVSGVWDDPKAYIPPGVGDVPAAPRQYDNGANLLCYAGVNHCGSDQAWAEGGVHGRDPVITTGPDGSSGCCSGFPWRMGGGLGLGGSAKPAPRQQRAIGGMGLGGSAILPGRQQVGIGGIGLGGWARQTGPMPFFGGLGLGGVAYQLGHTQAMVGGLGLGGVAYQLGHTQAMVGGLGLGGVGAQAGGGYIIVSIPDYPYYAIIQGGARLQGMTGGLGLGGETEQGGDVPILGEIRWIPYAAIPTGWIIAQGDLLSRSTYAALFAVLGTTWGVGDGSTTFGTPDLRRRSIVGEGGTVVFGPSNTIGSYGGEEGHLLTFQESGMPDHVHAAAPSGGSYVTNVSGAAANIQVIGGGGYALNPNTRASGAFNAVLSHNTYHPVAVLRPIMYVGV